jgi:hypothetical protein
VKSSSKLFATVAVTILVVAIAAFYFSSHNKGEQRTETVSTSTNVLPTTAAALPAPENEKITVDIASCKLQQSNVYLCPAAALADFGPVTVKNTGQQNTCRISYVSEVGYEFEGAAKTAKLSAGDFLASVTDTGGIANIVRSVGSQSLTFFVGGSERIVHVLIVDGKDYSRDQCLEI